MKYGEQERERSSTNDLQLSLEIKKYEKPYAE
jgi:hypothetical protein